MREESITQIVQKYFFEALEPRCLLSADLADAFAGTIPAALPPQGNNTLSVLVSNFGSTTACGAATITLYASTDKTLDAGDTVLGAKTVNLNLAASHSVAQSVSFPAPTTLASGPYYILADVEGSAAIRDLNAANNVVATAATVQITKPFMDLTGAFGSAMKLPVTDVSGDGKSITVPVVVKNLGNVTARSGQKIDIQIDAFDGTTTTPLKTLTARSISGLGVGASATFTATLTLPAGLATGTYHLVATVDSSNSVTSDPNRANNTVTSSGATGTTAVTKGYVDLTGAFGTATKLPATDISGDGKSISVPVVVKNLGNVAAPSGQKIDIQIDAFDGTTTTPIKTLTARSISALGVGASATLTATLTLPAGLATGTYHLVATVDRSNSVTSDPNRANNTATSSGATGTIAVTKGYVDLTSSITKMPASPIVIHSKTAQQPSTSFPVVVTNNGNLPVKGNLNLKYSLSTDQTLDAADLLIFSGSKPINIKPGLSSIITLAAKLGPTTPTGGLYGLIQLNSDKRVPESDTTNDVGPSTAKVTISNSAVPSGPWLLGGLNTDTNVVIIGHAGMVHFSVQVSEPSASTAIAVNEVSDQGAFISKITDLYDNGSAAVGDPVAGDGLFNGQSSIEVAAAGQRHFIAVLTDPSVSQQPTSSVAITGVALPSTSQLQRDDTDASAVNAKGTQMLNAHSSAASVVNALKTMLRSSTNVKTASIVTSPTAILWESSDGILHGFDTSTFNSGNLLNAPTEPSEPEAGPLMTQDDASTDNGGTALILSPFASSLSSWDSSSQTESLLANDGYTVTYEANQNVTISSFTNFGQYDAIALYGHGGLLPGGQGGEVFYTSQQPTLLSEVENGWDLLTHRLIELNGYYAVTPSFIDAYAGSMNGTIVFAAACNSAFDSQMANAFIGNGAAAYLGFTHVVKATFAASKEIATFQTLLQEKDNTVWDIPGLFVDHDTNNPAAYFTAYGDMNATLPHGALLKNNQLYVNYNWPQTERDLDSNTTFLGVSAGWHLSGSQYVNWSGDDTSAGGSETSLVRLYDSWKDSAWSGSTTITAGADWYTPAGGDGPAYITIGLKDTTTGKITDARSFVVYPGQEDSGASSTFESVNVTLKGDPLNPTVHIAVS